MDGFLAGQKRFRRMWHGVAYIPKESADILHRCLHCLLVTDNNELLPDNSALISDTAKVLREI